MVRIIRSYQAQAWIISALSREFYCAMVDHQFDGNGGWNYGASVYDINEAYLAGGEL